MSISSTWEEGLEGILRRHGSQIARIFHSDFETYKHAVQMVFPFLKGGNQDIPNDQDSHQPKIVTTSWGEELGYLVHMSSFPRKYFPDHVIELIDYSDRRNKAIHRENPEKRDRKMGGVYDNHPLAMLEIHYKIAAEIAPVIAELMGLKVDDALGLVLDYRGMVSKKRHDDFEDHKDLSESIKQFKDARKEAVRIDSDLTQITPEYKEMMRWRDEIKRIRAGIISDEHQGQVDFISSIASGYGLDDAKKSELIIGGDIAMGVMDWMTRHTEENFFTGSNFRLKQRYSAADYIKNERGGPFQAYLMRSLGLDGKEPILHVLMRIYDKTLDRIANSKERKPRYTQPWHGIGGQVGELEFLFKQHKWLRDVYGDSIIFKVDEGLSRPDRLEELYKNSVVLNNMHRALSDYGGAVIRQRKKDPTAYTYLLALLKAREYLIKESTEIIDELKKEYKHELGGEAEEIAKRVNDMPSLEFRMVTGEGPISNGYRYETGQRVNIEAKGSTLQIEDNYQDVLGFEKLMHNFVNGRNVIDPVNGSFRLFTIGGLNEGISFNIHPKPYRRT